MIAFNCFSDLKPIILCLFWMSGVSLLIFKVPPNLHGCPPGKNLHGRFFRGNSHKLIINRKVMKCKSNTTIFCFANCFLKAVEAFNAKTIDWSSTIEKFAKRVALGVAKRKLVKIKKKSPTLFCSWSISICSGQLSRKRGILSKNECNFSRS